MHSPKFLTAVALALAMSLSGPAVMAQGKKKGDGGKPGTSKVMKRASAPSAARVSRGSSKPSSVPTVVRSGGNRGEQRVSRPTAQRQVERRIASPNRSQRQLATPSDDSARRAVSRARADSRTSDSRNAELVRREIRDRDDNRRRGLNRTVRDRDGDRDRSRYVTRHERHDHNWFVRNNYIYDRDYWHSHHVHRYYNDLLGVYIISPIGPSYAYGASYVDGYSDYRGFDYETRVAVQQALAEQGYYNGPIDGMIGPGTMAAIRNFQADNGLAVTGRINNSLMQSLDIL